MVITTAQLHSTKPAVKFCTDLNRACNALEICNGEDLWQWSWIEIRLNAFHWSTIPQKEFIIIIIIIITIIIILLSSSILLAVLASIKLLLMKTIAPHMCVFFNSYYLWHWWIQLGPWSIQDRTLCDKSQRLEVITIVTKSYILYVASVLDPPLKSTDKLR